MEQELIKMLKSQTNAEVAQFYGVNIRTIARWRKKYGLSREFVKYGNYESLNEGKIEIMNGCLLGDGGIEKRTKRFRFGQSLPRREYVEWIFNTFKPYSSKIITNEDCRMYTIAHSLFKEIRKNWYKNNIKIVPHDLKITAQTLAHWVVQDGCNNQSKKAITISTNCFTTQEVEFLIYILKRDLNIKSSLNFQKQQPVIRISSYEYFKVIQTISPFVTWDCFKYKLDTSKVKRNNPNLGACKLNKKKANEIRKLHRNEKMSVAKIAEIYKVRISSIYNVLNNITYKEKDVAEVKVIYNPSTLPLQ